MKKHAIHILLAALLVSYTAKGQNIPDGSASVPGLPTNTFSTPQPYTASGTYNLSRTWVPNTRVTDENSTRFNLSPGLSYKDVNVVTTYFNGWGKPIESIKRGYYNPSSPDIVTPYDNRQSDTSLGFLSYNTPTTSQFRSDPFTEEKNYYQSLYPNEDNTAATEKIISYPNVIPTVTTYAPGKGLLGQGRGTVVQTLINSANEVTDYVYESNGTLSNLGFYAEGTLSDKVTTTANGDVMRQYTDLDGHIVCKQVQTTDANNNTTYLYTYYVYDESGRLGMVIPPKVIANGQTDYSQSCYWYDYDAYDNIIKRHVPDQQGNYIAIYDGNHRVVLMQSPLMATHNQYNFTIYDGQGRSVISGIYTDATSPDNIQSAIYNPSAPPASGSLMDYVINGFKGTYPASIPGCEIDMINYYDRYPTGDPQLSGRTFNNSFASDYASGLDVPVPFMFTQGLLTASKTRVKDSTNSLPNEWVDDVFFYDRQGRLIQTQTLNPWNTTNWDVSTTEYDFTGKPIKAIMQYYDKSTSEKPTVKIVTTNNYDKYNDNRITSSLQSTDNTTASYLAQYKYDSLGRVYNKYIGNVENQYYDYNIRGQLTGINSDYVRSGCGTWIQDVTFGSMLYYDYGFNEPRYDGKISGRTWREAGGTSAVPDVKAYGYDYDGAGRMTHAEFREYSDGISTSAACGGLTSVKTWNKELEDYTVSNISYDANGNLLTVNRRGTVPGGPVDIDQLTYQYNGNQLNGVIDNIDTNYQLGDFQDGNKCIGTTWVNGHLDTVYAANCQDYSYDADGNLSQDLNKNIQSIYCNENDQPLKVSFNNGSTISNIYDASGALVQKTISDPANNVNDVYRYWGPFVYRNDSLLYATNDEGRVRYMPDSNLYRYDYFVKDDQGNVRSVETAVAPSAQSYLSTYEVARANIENIIFNNVASVRTVKPGSTNPDDIEAARLNGADSARRIGTSLMIHVMAGDKFDLSADSYWEQDTTDERTYAMPNVVLQSLFSTLAAGGTTTATGESNTAYLSGAYNSTSENLSTFQGLMDNATVDQSAPRAYLTYLVFDEKMNLVPSQSGAIQVASTPGGWQTVGTTTPVTVGQNGYVLLYEGNAQYKDVYIDNFHISLYQGKLIQQQQYYPFGLTVNEGQNGSVTPNKYLYEGKEYHDELGYDLYDFQARQYDPQLGRFWGIDPANQYPSGYTGMGNDPANLVDPTGMFAGGKNSSSNGYIGGGDVATVETRSSEIPQQGDYSGDYGSHEIPPTEQEAANSSTTSQAADATDACADPNAADPTDVYTNNGTYVTTVNDGTNNVYIINAGEEGLFYSAAAGALLSGNGIDLTNSTFGGIGINYDVAAFSKFYDDYGTSTPASTLSGVSLQDAHNFEFNGQSFTPYAEVTGHLILSNNIVTVGHATPRSDGDMTYVYPQLLAHEANVVGDIHTHPISTNGDMTSVKYYMSGPGGSFQAGPSIYYHGEQPPTGDYPGVSPYTNYRNVVVDHANIYLYNSHPDQTIKIKR